MVTPNIQGISINLNLAFPEAANQSINDRKGNRYYMFNKKQQISVS